MGVAPRIPGSSKTNLEYMGALTQNGNTGDMNKSLSCKGHTTYLVLTGRDSETVKFANVIADNGAVSKPFTDTASVYSSYLNTYVNAKPLLDSWIIEGCKKTGTNITITCPGSVWLAFFVYGM